MNIQTKSPEGHQGHFYSRMKTIFRTYQFELKPTQEQKVLLDKHFGCIRYVYNYFLNERKEQYQADKKSDNYYKQAATLTELKKKEETERLENSDSYCEKHWFEYVAKAHLGTMKRGSELKLLLEKQNYKCAYTGIVLIPALNASIDHKMPLSLDSEQYQKIENLQWVCLDINTMKRNHTEEDFLEYIKLIYENRLAG